MRITISKLGADDVTVLCNVGDTVNDVLAKPEVENEFPGSYNISLNGRVLATEADLDVVLGEGDIISLAPKKIQGGQ